MWRPGWTRVQNWISTLTLIGLIIYVNLFKPALPVWLIVSLGVVAVIGMAAYFAYTFVKKPPSVDRFRTLFTVGSVIALYLVIGLIALFLTLPIDMDAETSRFVVVIAGLSFAVGFGACFVWYYTKVQSNGRWKAKDPDFGEDEVGNPVRPSGDPP